MQALLAKTEVRCQVGGGVRDESKLEQLLVWGAARVVVGTRAVRDPKWLSTVSQKYPDRILVAADVRGEVVTVSGWTEQDGLPVDEFLRGIRRLPLAGILMTDVNREGRLEGVRAAWYEQRIHQTEHPVIASGGIRGREDLRALEEVGVAGAVVGMALYTGDLDARTIAEEYGK